MYCEFKCQNCDEWHPLAEFSTRQLRSLQLYFLINPPEPFNNWQWAMIIDAEVKRRTRAGR